MKKTSPLFQLLATSNANVAVTQNQDFQLILIDI